MQALSPGARASDLAQLSEALTGTCWFVVPMLELAVVFAVAMKERPLRDNVHVELAGEI